MVLFTGLVRLSRIFGKSRNSRDGSCSPSEKYAQSFNAHNSFTPAERKTDYREIPSTVDLTTQWLGMTDPSLLQDPETVAMQVASLTEFASETIPKLSTIFAVLQDMNIRVGELERKRQNER